jgi:hypothetical protein
MFPGGSQILSALSVFLEASAGPLTIDQFEMLI